MRYKWRICFLVFSINYIDYFPLLSEITENAFAEMTAIEKQKGEMRERASNVRATLNNLSFSERDDILSKLNKHISSQKSVMTAGAPPREKLRLADYERARTALQAVVLKGPYFATDEQLGETSTEEAIIKVAGRPGLIICQDDIKNKSKVRIWEDDIMDFIQNFKERSRSVGILEISKFADEKGKRRYEPIGTAFVAKRGFVLTNRHVVDKFLRPENDLFTLRKGHQLRIDFVREDKSCNSGSSIYQVKGVVVHKSLDLVALSLKGNNHPPPLEFAVDSRERGGNVIAVIGYPSEGDAARADLELAFTPPGPPPVFFVKRFEPGYIIGLHQNDITEFDHDASTLGGNSGSPIIRLSDGMVVGIHTRGIPYTYNTAIDSRLIDEFVRSLP
jgi:S1-C subfamily serine protease